MDWMRQAAFEDRWRALVAADYSENAAFRLLEASSPKEAAEYLAAKVEETLQELLGETHPGQEQP